MQVSSVAMLMLAGTATALNATAKGPYKVVQSSHKVAGMDATSTTVQVYRPADDELSAGKTFPLISFLHGNTAQSYDYIPLLEGLAGFGFVVAAPEACQYGCAACKTLLYDPPCFGDFYLEQLKAIDWAKTQASAFKIDLSKPVGVTGHSMGGQGTVYSAAYNASSHNIAAAVMLHAYTHSYPAPKVPFLAMTGSADVIAYPFMTEYFYNAAGASSTKAQVNKYGSTHFEPIASGNPALAQFVAAYFKLYVSKVKSENGINYDDLIYGTGATSLCHGGDGAMTACEVNR